MLNKLMKSKKGFTLIEMVLVIAIIVILASVMVIAVSGYLSKAQSAKAKVESHNSDISSAMNAISVAGG